jgi:hypothetical protein
MGAACMQKPQNINDYAEWLKGEHGVEANTEQAHYETVTATIKQDFEKSDFWVEFVGNIKEYNDRYLMNTRYPLFVSVEKPELKIKTFESFLLKTFRKNVIDNEHYPSPPKGDWILPSNWFSRINDILRTTLAVKYLDGVDFMRNVTKSHCTQYGMDFEDHLEAREEGYYAAHVYMKRKFEVPKIPWDTEQIYFSIEMQITTVVQEVIRRLLHKYYEERRKRTKERDMMWQWDYQCDEFSANYLGHILHYVEGMIMDVRERQKEATI